ncbi:lycopene cyclase domain-containing protein [Amycolatopsis lexingtonensis]|uniref:Lycopene cyclase domain-containing protein n=1 Tax=Amycolatopsis lexingtonensis TaxID=218822 RepID=A0ABR9HXG3_9PSEU|nr:lycopene cyclase domain-containing protein [Amycolatopsis lexingtonensis]MBE1495612.1 lycopene cyclase domain-containing protein [Amycolatopsis lexingtonensis]
MGKLEYLLVLAACVVVTLPLELAGARVYRRPRRLARAVLPVAAVFLVWDAIAIAAGAWDFDPAFVTGVRLPLGIPLEEVLFFAVVPICGLLTYEAVQLTGRLATRLLRRRERVPR